MRRELSTLIRSTLCYFKQEFFGGVEESPKKPAPSMQQKGSKKSNSNWVLQPMLSPGEKKKGLFVPVRLLLEDEIGEHRLLLENLARAITKQYAPACVELAEEFTWDTPLVIASCAVAQKKIKNPVAHRIYNTPSFTLISLESIDLYLSDRNVKKALWQIIQSYPFHKLRPSSS